jgi:hypothetical protein
LNYQLMIPDGTQKREDPDIVSFWQHDCDIVLQLSSRHRFAGEKISADQRLNEAIVRMAMTNIVRERVEIDACPDVAAATMIDPEKSIWTYCYAVWPDLAVFATIGGATSTFYERRGWAVEAICSIRRSAGGSP